MIMETGIYVYGEELPKEELDCLLADGNSIEDLTPEFLEGYYYWEYMDYKS